MLVLVFAAVLVVAVLVSGLAHRTVLSTAVLFLAAGVALGENTLGVLQVSAQGGLVKTLAELALFAVLFTDGMRVGARDLAAAWRLPGRALLLGMPLAMAFTAVLAHALTGLSWVDSFLVGAVLAPTDPVFAAAIVGREEVPGRLRHLLNVESGLNDGLALPFVLVLLAVSGEQPAHPTGLLAEIGLGIAIGIGVPLVAAALERLPIFGASTLYEPLNAFAVGLLVLGICQVTHANLFLGAFAAGVTIETIAPQLRESFERFGNLVSELLKLAALLVFGAVISPALIAQTSPLSWLFVVLALLAVRPLSLGLSLIGSALNRGERLAAAWFGPKGFASVVYGLIVLESDISAAATVFHLIALVTMLSMLAHSSTDVLVARHFSQTGSSG